MVGKVLSLAQPYLDQYYADDHPQPFQDEFRTYMFGQPFARYFHKDRTSRFEFIDFFAEHNADLNCHCDFIQTEPLLGTSSTVHHTPSLSTKPMAPEMIKANTRSTWLCAPVMLWITG